MLLPCTLYLNFPLLRFLSFPHIHYSSIRSSPIPSHSAYPSTRTTIPRALLPFVILLNELPRALVHRHPSPILHHPYPIPLYINRYYQFIPCRCPYSPQRSPTDLPLLPRSMDTSTPPPHPQFSTILIGAPQLYHPFRSFVRYFSIVCCILYDRLYVPSR